MSLINLTCCKLCLHRRKVFVWVFQLVINVKLWRCIVCFSTGIGAEIWKKFRSISQNLKYCCLKVIWKWYMVWPSKITVKTFSSLRHEAYLFRRHQMCMSERDFTCWDILSSWRHSCCLCVRFFCTAASSDTCCTLYKNSMSYCEPNTVDKRYHVLFKKVNV